MEANHLIRIENRADYTPIAIIHLNAPRSFIARVCRAISTGMPDVMVRVFSRTVTNMPVDVFSGVIPRAPLDPPTILSLTDELRVANAKIQELLSTDIGAVIQERDDLLFRVRGLEK